MSTGRKGPGDWEELRERLREFYAYAFLPPSVTDDDFDSESDAPNPGPDAFDGFVLTEWLEGDRQAGPQEPPARPQIVTEEPVAAGETIERERRFEFVEWLASGESGFEPIDIGEGPAEPVELAMPESEPTTGPRLGIKPHPAKAATYALFLAVLTLAVLSVVGYAPVLGPATGLGG